MHTPQLNVLMISDVYFPRINGVSTSIMTFRRSLHEQGHATTLIAPCYGDGVEQDDVLRVASRYLFMDPEDRLMKIRDITRLTASLRQQRFDIIHIQTPFAAHLAGMRLAKALDLPVVETYHTHFEEYFYHYLPLLPRAFMRLCARVLTRRQGRQVDALIVPSRAMKAVLKDYGVATPTSIIPTGIDLDAFTSGDRAAFCRRYGIDPARPTLVHIGRVALEKNIGFLLQVVAQMRRELPALLLIIAGEGPALGALRKRVRTLGIDNNVMFIGYLQRGPALWDCYAAGNAFVFASGTETQGLVLLEAMTLGVPVVSTAVLGTRDILEPGKGALVAQPTLGDFVDKTRRVLTDGALRQRLAAEAREYAASWSIEVMTARLVEFYSCTIAERAAQGCPVQPAPGDS